MSLYERFYKRPIITFIILIASGLTFGAMTVNIFRLFAANWNFILTYGLLALREGALTQTLELLITGMLSMVFFLVFKFCEKILIDRISSYTFSLKRIANKKKT
ncbi:MAG: hypothetical protein KUF77_04355 [Candidatus Thiodiazotropha sp. (ex Lucina aurantia)]|uniref:Uncharacterized protein n=1 Tax=Candidatus Thiodiazotropha endolucinida TaxID=1655433 RepID=A0A7Z1AF40_9GAMM|nr:hypothetical protein [Candidatus Thiodiazotropha endolucinida]MBT3010483.1 hypothetical protein [Candidatus Thiodiazotropha sp. (ex Lucina pensylvanica)]MBT3016244.1 hypothetical protein [Candidatus Thiodiazotropha taylori]MBT3040167.1 hypothetical protein [Candidatus Thiodiazotropha sp. (ex Codakia orbicularis)]MBV2102240.1 hypothetical protein [Candidatus Thiodiazotropha sp. (ex Lucina aurantia)]MBT3022163.1 hypothetical protein [Candidatus Thiodiazotropha taylori]